MVTVSVAAGFLAACGSQDNENLGIVGYVKGFLGGVVADEPKAVQVGREILSSGGSAADAAVATYFALSVTLPSSAGLGGGGVCMVYDPARKNDPEVLDFVARAPRSIPSTAVRPSGIPGNARGFFALYSKYGRLRWSSLVAPAENLARFGIQFDVARIAPWKTAADQLNLSEMSEAAREQINWLLDSLSGDIVQTIAAGRGLEPDAVQDLIDRAPLTADETLSAGLIDKALYKDELGAYLESEESPATLKTYASVRGLLLRRPRSNAPRSIGVIALRGAITGGESRSYPIPLPVLGEGTIGSTTVEQQIRSARRDKGLAAVVVYVDSGGGSAMASDLICRELDLLNREKPVIVYMGDVAASGGYYIATPARKIIAQSATLTGSIGVIVAKPVTAGALDKLDAHREVIQRGRNAGLYAEDSAWTDDQRAQVEASVRHYYDAFKQRVADGRGLDIDTLDSICNGRVWTGRQALDHGLVDELGDFQTALDLACAAAELSADDRVRVRTISAPRNRILPEPASPADALLGETITDQLQGLAAALLQGNWQTLIGPDRYWYLADGLPKLDEIRRRL